MMNQFGIDFLYHLSQILPLLVLWLFAGCEVEPGPDRFSDFHPYVAEL